MILIIVINLICMVVAWREDWSLTRRLVLLALLLGSWLVPPMVATGASEHAGQVLFVLWQLALGVYFVIRFGIANRRVYG